jgi:hypothetical protein
VTARKVSEDLTVTVGLRYTWGKMGYGCGMVIEANDEFFILTAPHVAIDIHNDMRGKASAKLCVVPWRNEGNEGLTAKTRSGKLFLSRAYVETGEDDIAALKIEFDTELVQQTIDLEIE